MPAQSTPACPNSCASPLIRNSVGTGNLALALSTDADARASLLWKSIQTPQRVPASRNRRALAQLHPLQRLPLAQLAPRVAPAARARPAELSRCAEPVIQTDGKVELRSIASAS
jgi:hypothetical protein